MRKRPRFVRAGGQKLHLTAPRVPGEYARNNHPSHCQTKKVGLSLALKHITTGESYSYFPGSNGRVRLLQVRRRRPRQNAYVKKRESCSDKMRRGAHQIKHEGSTDLYCEAAKSRTREASSPSGTSMSVIYILHSVSQDQVYSV